MELETPTPQVFYKDFPQICRLCLTTENLKSIYSDSVILNAFKYIPSIKVKQDDKLPQNICTNCMTKLEEIHEFIKKCEDNDALLKAVVPQENLQEASSIPNWPRPIKQETIDVDRFESVELNQFKEEVGENVENIVFEIVGDEVSLNGEVKTETTEESGKKEDDVLSGSPKKAKKRKKKSKLKLRDGGVSQDKDPKKKIRGLLKKLKQYESSGLLKVDIQNLPKKNKEVAQDNVKLISNSSKKNTNSIVVESPHKKRRKHSRSDEISDVEQTDVTKEQKKLLKKYSLELNTLNIESDRLHEELLQEKTKQEELKKKQLLLQELIQLKKKNKHNNSTPTKKSRPKLRDLDSDEESNYHLSNKSKKNESDNPIMFTDQPSSSSPINKTIDFLAIRKKKLMLDKLKSAIIQQKVNEKPVLTLRQKMMEKLKAARFRFLNEQIYTTTSKEAQKIFRSDPEAFTAYHEGYQQQVRSWPLNPLDVIIDNIKKMPKNYVVADFGCGDANLAKSVDQKVHSFDLVAVDDTVMACDMSNVPLRDESVDVAVFCLSLMGTNLHDYLLEANRVLKIGGLLKIAEVESRFEKVDNFIEGVQRFGFRKTWKDFSNDLFYFLDFKKNTNVKNRKKLPTISLLPCLYKKR